MSQEEAENQMSDALEFLKDIINHPETREFGTPGNIIMTTLSGLTKSMIASVALYCTTHETLHGNDVLMIIKDVIVETGKQMTKIHQDFEAACTTKQ